MSDVEEWYRAQLARIWSADYKPDREAMRCDGCGAAFGSGCSCVDNARSIGRGERRKTEAEEGR